MNDYQKETLRLINIKLDEVNYKPVKAQEITLAEETEIKSGRPVLQVHKGKR